MFDLIRQFLSYYQLETNPIVAPLIFALLLLILRLIVMSLASSEFKNLAKEDRKRLKKHFQSRSLVGWVLWLGAWGLISLGYYGTLPAPLMDEVYLGASSGLLFLLSLTLHFLALAQAAVQTLLEKKSLSLVG